MSPALKKDALPQGHQKSMLMKNKTSMDTNAAYWKRMYVMQLYITVQTLALYHNIVAIDSIANNFTRVKIVLISS